MNILNSFRYRVVKPIFINPPYSIFTRNIIAKLLTKKKFELSQNQYILSAVDHIKNHGFFQTDVNKIELLKQFQILNKQLKQNGIPTNGNIKDINNNNLTTFINDAVKSGDSKKYKIQISNLFSCDLINEIVNNKYLVNIASNYLNTKVKKTYSEIVFDHNVMNEKKDVETQMYHRDHNGILFLKIFIYLNNVQVENGPYCYVEGSHKKNFLKENKINLTTSKIRLVNRYNNSEVQKKLFPYEKSFLGSEGSVIFSDTTGLHRGIRPRFDKFRVLLSITYEAENNFFSFTEN